MRNVTLHSSNMKTKKHKLTVHIFWQTVQQLALKADMYFNRLKNYKQLNSGFLVIGFFFSFLFFFNNAEEKRNRSNTGRTRSQISPPYVKIRKKLQGYFDKKK